MVLTLLSVALQSQPLLSDGNPEPESESESDSESESEAEPVPAPGQFTVDEEAAVRALERSLFQLDALLLSAGRAELGLGFYMGQDRQSTPVLLQDNLGGLFAGSTDVRTDTLSLQFDAQLGLPFGSELDVSVPFLSVRHLQSSYAGGILAEERDDTSSSIGDVQLTLLKSITYEAGYMPDLIGFVSVDSDTADEKRPPTGSGAVETSVGFNATKRQDPLVFTFGLSHTLPTDTSSVEVGSITRLTAGTVLAASPRTSLQFLFHQSIAEASVFRGQKIALSDGLSASLQLGVSSVVTGQVFLSASVITGLTESGADYTFSVLISKRFEFMR